jgi:hypothetical protein
MMAECMVPMDVIDDVKGKLEETVSGAIAVLGKPITSDPSNLTTRKAGR